MRTLVAGVGNIFRGDDAFGVEVVRRLAARIGDPSVEVRDFGIRGLELGYTLLEGGYDRLIVVDAVQRGGAPGTVYLIDPELESAGDPESVPAETHGMHPAKVFAWVSAMGGRLGAVRVVGCEPGELGSDEEVTAGLSGAVEAAVEPAIRAITTLLEEARCTS